MSVLDSLNMDEELESPQSERKAFFNCVENYYGGGSVHFSKPGKRKNGSQLIFLFISLTVADEVIQFL